MYREPGRSDGSQDRPEPDRRRIDPLTREQLPAADWSATIPVRFGHCDPRRSTAIARAAGPAPDLA